MALLLGNNPLWRATRGLWSPIDDIFTNFLNDDYPSEIACCENPQNCLSCDTDRFQANLDVQHFKPDEISVKVTNNSRTVTIEGKHEENRDEHGYISRHFVRKYVVPETHDLEKVATTLSSDGVLTITVPKVQPEGVESTRHVPITRTGEPNQSES